MSRSKILFVAVVLCVACNALSSSSAGAATAGWMVNETLLSGSAALGTTDQIDKIGKLTAAGITIECKGKTLNSVAPEIKSPNTGAASSLEFTECESLSSDCAVEPSNIKSVPTEIEATLEGTLAVVITEKPKTKSTFATIRYVGTNCALAGTESVTGQLKVLLPTGQDERTLQLENSITTESSNELKVASNPAGLEISVLVGLASLRPWRYL